MVTAYLRELEFSARVASKRKDESIDWLTTVFPLRRKNSVGVKSTNTEVRFRRFKFRPNSF